MKINSANNKKILDYMTNIAMPALFTSLSNDKTLNIVLNIAQDIVLINKNNLRIYYYILKYKIQKC